jgi:UDP:flavonoid glycosyltransferase YjiC (YdhE family)
MKTVLFAWELGGGKGHITTLSRLAKRLKHLDLRFVAVVKSPDAAGALSELGVEVMQAPLWPSASMTDAQIAKSSSSTMGDVLATAGLADRQGLSRLLGEWDHHFARIRPDLVVADLAPAAGLAARGRIPLMLVGNGYTLPPAEMQRFPPLHQISPPASAEQETLSVVNAVLQGRGQARLDRLPQVFAADARLVLTFPLLDPYGLQRVQPVDGPVLDEVPRASDPDAGTIFAYLSREYRLHRDSPAAFRAVAPRLRIHAPGLSDAQAGELRQAGAIVEVEPVQPANALASARLIVHYGGGGLAAEALAAGVPQLVLSMQVEQDLNGSALLRAGLGRLIRAYDPASRIDAKTIDELFQDNILAQQAREAGRTHREWLGYADTLAKFESKGRELLRI